MQAGAGRGDPARIRVGGEQARLLGVGTEGAGDRERVAVPASARRHAVEGRGHVGAHRLAHPVRQRAVVAAAAATCRPRERIARCRRQLGRGACPHRDGAPAPRGRPVQVHLHRVADSHPDPCRCERHAGERDVAQLDPGIVAPSAGRRRAACPREVGGERQVARVRRPAGQHGRQEQTRVVALHRSGRRHGRQVRGPLRGAPPAERLAEGRENEHPHEQCGQHAEHQHQCLAGLVSKARELHPPEPARHRVTAQDPRVTAWASGE